MLTHTDIGFPTRRDYLEHLAQAYSIDIETVVLLAGILGGSQDFTGLINALKDIARDK